MCCILRVDWSKYPLTQQIWEEFGRMSLRERRVFLKEHSLQYTQGHVPQCEDCLHVFFNCQCNNQEFQERKKLWLKELSKSFEEKLRHSEDIVREKTQLIKDNNLKIVLAYSGGIDSECCLQLFKEPISQGVIKVIVGNTTSELPDTYKRWREAEQELGVKFMYGLPERGTTFESNANIFGLPVYSRNACVVMAGEKKHIKREESSSQSRRSTIMCCFNLKDKPQKLLLKGYDGDILGLKATESRGRSISLKKTGDCFFSNDMKWHIRPIAWWTIDDEWEFQKEKGFKYNGIYDKTNCGTKGKYKLSTGGYYKIRSGCAYCPQGIHNGYLEWLKEYYPTYFNKLVNIYNNVSAKHNDGIDFNKVLEIKKVKNPSLFSSSVFS